MRSTSVQHFDENTHIFNTTYVSIPLKFLRWPVLQCPTTDVISVISPCLFPQPRWSLHFVDTSKKIFPLLFVQSPLTPQLSELLSFLTVLKTDFKRKCGSSSICSHYMLDGTLFCIQKPPYFSQPINMTSFLLFLWSLRAHFLRAPPLPSPYKEKRESGETRVCCLE